ncbi:hypothetical protein BDQ17DRAFT_1333118 [Cyathus striatus]|nr:hypothetical protein BDQ17DRAFT_1333118 [Cyathus striatus]
MGMDDRPTNATRMEHDGGGHVSVNLGHTTPKSDFFRKAQFDDISEHVKFHAPPGSKEWVAKLTLCETPEYECSLAALKRQFDPPPTKRATSSPRIDKGKGKETSPTEDDIPRLHEDWFNSYADILNGTPNHLPPFCEVNHKINLIDESKHYKYHMPRCPNTIPMAPPSPAMLRHDQTDMLQNTHIMTN